MQLLFQIKQAASEIGVGKTKLYQLVNQHELELVKIGSKSLITGSSLRALVARLTEAKRGIPDANANGAQKSGGA